MMQPDDTAVANSEAAQASEILRELEERIGARTFNLWVRDNASLEIKQDHVTVNVHNKFLLSWLQQRYRPAITQAVQLVLGDGVAVRFRESLLPAAQKQEAPPTVRPTNEKRTTPSQPPIEPWKYVAGGRTAKAQRYAKLPTPLAAIPVTAVALSRPHQRAAQPARDLQAPSLASACGEGDEARPTSAPPADRCINTPTAVASSSGAASPPNRRTTGGNEGGPAPSMPPAGRRFADLNDFVPGPSNQLAFTAALQICEQPGAYNPLVLYGGVGIGKTHLLEGIYRRMRARYPALRIVFLSAESFANYFTQALRDRTLPSFRQRFRGVDVLMVDDVDFLDGKRVIQEEFLHTIKQLESHQRQVAVTSDRHPRLLTRLSEELVTRFVSGIFCRLESPDLDTRRTIVARKAARMTARITDEAIEFVVQRFALSVRELEGALNFLENYGQTTGKTINLTVARNVLADIDRDCVRIVRVAEVEQAVCRLFSVGVDDLRSARRTRTVSQPRMLAMYLARKMTQAAYTEIGEHFGGRNHSTVMSAEKRVRSLLEADATVRAGTQDWKLGDLLASLEQQLLTG